MNYVIYHANCPDGFLAAYCAWEILGDDCEYIPCSYQSPMPDLLPDSIVYILDFSFPKEQMIELASKMKQVTVIDHHKTAQANFEGLEVENLTLIFDMTKCGSMLTWEFFHPNEEPEMIYGYVQDRDLWQWKLPNSKEVSAYLYLQPKEFKHYRNVVLRTSTEEMIAIGRIILKTQDKIVNDLVERAFFQEIGGYIIPVVNSSILQSELGNALNIKYPEAPFAGVFNFLKNMNSINWSLRSQGNFDVSEVAKQFGGGGHKNAAGFVSPFNKP